MRWVWIDRFVEFESGKSATTVKNLSMAEDIFAEHFPGYPVMPAPLILEGLAQTGGILVGEARDFKEKVVLAKIPNAKFHREVFSGDQLTYRTDVLVLRDEGATVAGTVKVNGELVAEAEIFFAHLDQNMGNKLFGDANFVFSGELRKMVNMARSASKPSTTPPSEAPTAS